MTPNNDDVAHDRCGINVGFPVLSEKHRTSSTEPETDSVLKQNLYSLLFYNIIKMRGEQCEFFPPFNADLSCSL